MLKPGDTFDRYTIDAVIGQGGMGVVYRAHDSRLDRRVALKVISEDGAGASDAGSRVLREARAAAALDHPNAVSIFDVGEVNGARYIVMELVPGRTLRDVVGDASVPVEKRTAWLADAARALATAHRHGLVHRDVKPENVMVRDDGMVKVLDFGIARRAETAGGADASAPTQSPALPTLTKEGVKMGTPAYMAPEQIKGDAVDGRADQFAWGVVAYELLTGAPPWRSDRDALALVASILTDDVPAAPLERAGVPRKVTDTVRRALSKRPADRFASMDELLESLTSEPFPTRAAARDVAGARAPSPRGEQPPATPRPSPNATALQRFTTAEVQEVLRRAVERQEAQRGDTRLGIDDLEDAAREVGVSAEVVREASRELRARKASLTSVAAKSGDAQATWMRRKRRSFFRHAGIWAIVCTAVLLDGAVSHHLGDGLKLLLFWGIAVGIHGVRAFMSGEDEWHEEVEQRERADRKKRRRGEAFERAIDEGANLLLQTGAAVRRRVVAAPPPDATGDVGRARIAVSGSAVDAELERQRDAAAEDEAAVAPDAPRRRR